MKRALSIQGLADGLTVLDRQLPSTILGALPPDLFQARDFAVGPYRVRQFHSGGSSSRSLITYHHVSQSVVAALFADFQFFLVDHRLASFTSASCKSDLMYV